MLIQSTLYCCMSSPRIGNPLFIARRAAAHLSVTRQSNEVLTGTISTPDDRYDIFVRTARVPSHRPYTRLYRQPDRSLPATKRSARETEKLRATDRRPTDSSVNANLASSSQHHLNTPPRPRVRRAKHPLGNLRPPQARRDRTPRRPHPIRTHCQRICARPHTSCERRHFRAPIGISRPHPAAATAIGHCAPCIGLQRANET